MREKLRGIAVGALLAGVLALGTSLGKALGDAQAINPAVSEELREDIPGRLIDDDVYRDKLLARDAGIGTMGIVSVLGGLYLLRLAK